MKKIKQKLFMVLVLLIAVLFFASAGNAAKPDIIVKISNIEKALVTIEELYPSDPGNPMQSPTFMIRAMLQGTDWLDPNRAVTIGIYFDEMGNPLGDILVPFVKANDGFKNAFNAIVGTNYYMIPYPVGQKFDVERDAEKILDKASRVKSDNIISASIMIKGILEKNRSKVDEMLAVIKSAPQLQHELDPSAPSREDLDLVLNNLVKTFESVDVFGIGVDFSALNLSVELSVDSAKGTELEKLYSSAKKLSLLSEYKPKGQINFRVLPYDVQGFMNLLDNTFGPIYKQMGLDFKKIAELVGKMNGETAGSFSMKNNRLEIESISVLQDPDTAQEFIEKHYLPWFRDYSMKMAEGMKKQTNVELRNFYEETKTSRVKGQKVFGVISRTPNMQAIPEDGDLTKVPMIESRMRITTFGKYLIVAPNDRRITILINKVKTLKEAEVAVPWIEGDMDYSAYINAVVAQSASLDIPQMPPTQRLKFKGTMAGGKTSFKMTMDIQDIKSIAEHANQLKTAKAQGISDLDNLPDIDELPIIESEMGEVEPEGKGEGEGDSPGIIKGPLTENDAEYWTRRAAASSMYGNDKAAVKYYDKALALEPENPDIYYLLAIACTGTGDYTRALKNINTAIIKSPDNGNYYYARGRALFLAGERDRATEDFIAAAKLGSQDAQDYLTETLSIDWE